MKRQVGEVLVLIEHGEEASCEAIGSLRADADDYGRLASLKFCPNDEPAVSDYIHRIDDAFVVYWDI